MSNLVKQNPGVPAQGGGGGFWDEFDAKDFAPPLVAIGQPSSAKYKHGEFNFNNGRHVPALKDVKLIVAKKGRVLFAGGSAACASDNFHQPSHRIKNPVTTNCMTCFAKDWGFDDDKSALAKRLKVQDPDDKPLCGEVFNLIMADETNTPFIISLMKVQLDVVKKKLFSRLRYEFSDVNPYQVAFDMSLQKSSQYNYYTIAFDNFRRLEAEEASALQSLYENLSGRAQGVISNEFEKADKAKRDESTQAPPWNDDDTSMDDIPF